jgi:hypothetical protein
MKVGEVPGGLWGQVVSKEVSISPKVAGILLPVSKFLILFVIN